MLTDRGKKKKNMGRNIVAWVVTPCHKPVPTKNCQKSRIKYRGPPERSTLDIQGKISSACGGTCKGIGGEKCVEPLLKLGKKRRF